MGEYTDNELIQLFRTGSNPDYAFNLLVKKYQERLYWHIRKIVIKHDDADDIMQNTFIKIWKALPGFREESSLYTWIYRIATNEALNHLRQARHKYLLPLVNVENQLSNSLESEPYFNGNELQIKLQKAILGLPEKQRIVFNMRYFDEMPYEQIAQILNTSEGALKASFHHAMKKIEKFILGD
jgi:RNA polymerase sigma-70 factor, ECF subfamily